MANQWMIDPDDAVMLLIDHQSGLFQLVRDIELPVLRSHATALAKLSYLATDLTVARVVQAGAIPIDMFALLCEIMQTWNRPDAMEFAAIMVEHIVPPYRALMESYDKAQSARKVGHETKLDRTSGGK